MAIIIAAELHSDLEALYKTAGELLNEIEMKENESFLLSKECPVYTRQLMELIKFKLEDMAGTLQKDIFNVRHIVMKLQTGEHGA